MNPRRFSRHLFHDDIVAAIQDAESKTTGRIRVTVCHKHVEDPMAAAQAEFQRLGMDAFAERNGVLIYVAPRCHQFAVVGDAEIHARCGDQFWRSLTEAMTGYFQQSEFTSGIIHGIEAAGKQLAEHFPRHPAGGM